jgi:HD-GYP domain-containing protein (c-di-GMP phosphodiesterase class II)
VTAAEPGASARVARAESGPRDARRRILAPVRRLVSRRAAEVLEVLAEAIEAKDPCLRGHGRRVAFYSGVLAERIDLGAPERESLRLAAFLHDLGKVGVPSELLRRAGALEPHERRIVERHPMIGARLLARLELPGGVTLALRHHHEWWDGGGYPDGVAGARIPLAARVIGVTDAFDAMTSDRPYRRALPREVAIAELGRWAGIQFDPELAREFVACVESGHCDAHPALASRLAEDGAALRAA